MAETAEVVTAEVTTVAVMAGAMIAMVATVATTVAVMAGVMIVMVATAATTVVVMAEAATVTVVTAVMIVIQTVAVVLMTRTGSRAGASALAVQGLITTSSIKKLKTTDKGVRMHALIL